MISVLEIIWFKSSGSIQPLNQTLLCEKGTSTLIVPLPTYKWVLGDLMLGDSEALR